MVGRSESSQRGLVQANDADRYAPAASNLACSGLRLLPPFRIRQRGRGTPEDSAASFDDSRGAVALMHLLGKRDRALAVSEGADLNGEEFSVASRCSWAAAMTVSFTFVMPGPIKLDFARRSVRQVDDASFDKRASILYADVHCALVREVLHSHPGIERIGPMGCRELLHIVDFAIRGASSVIRMPYQLATPVSLDPISEVSPPSPSSRRNWRK